MISQVLQSPDSFNGKEISVEGYIVSDPGRDKIFLTKDYADYSLNSGGLAFSVREPGPWTNGEVPSTKERFLYRIKWDKNKKWPSIKTWGAYGQLIGTFHKATSDRIALLDDVWFIYEHKK